ncbi:transketolase family protein [Limnohabitans sp. JirII-31]|uniref:transketolase family protein n=1 Tax=Limnohabitans sp. JirII-31 TaxID=1977908 RepID=UPI000C1E9413|nr:transketolase [Limnohabitans sp. JirII-31]PIT74716.1 transketolase [Limnohabitans sp. JirII-31]
MRNAFVEELVSYASENSKVALVVGDLGYSVVEPFADRFPERFINAGVAEQNMMGLAAGMASEGYHVFVYSIANFPTFRCAEQIRNDVDYHKLPVTVVSVGGGLAYGNMGYSHHAIQDYGLMRMFPNMLIAAPGDPMEVRACMRYLSANPQTSYLRLGKAGEHCLHPNVPNIEPGYWLNIKNGDDSCQTLLTTGAVLGMAEKWLSSSRYQGFALHSMPLWSMATKLKQARQLAHWKSVITIEDHLADCGFGSWLRESLEDSPQFMSRVIVRALDSKVCGMVGTQSMLNELGGLSMVKE